MSQEIEIVELEDYSPSRAERPSVERYMKALKEQDKPDIDFIRSIGESVRHRIMNLTAHEHALLFGYDNIELNEHGWIKENEWKHEQEIVFDKSNKIKLAQGFNDKWTWGYSYSFGAGAGGSSSPSYYGDVCETKEDAIKLALQHFYLTFLQAKGYNDSTNYNQKTISDILKVIKMQMLLNGGSPLAQEEPTFEMETIRNKKFTSSPQLALFGGTQLSF